MNYQAQTDTRHQAPEMRSTTTLSYWGQHFTILKVLKLNKELKSNFENPMPYANTLNRKNLTFTFFGADKTATF